MARLLDEAVVLLAIPIEKDDFLSRCGQSDYLSRFAREPDHWWDTVYRTGIAEPMNGLLNSALQLGACVRTQASLADLSAATKEFEVVILVSHWKGPDVTSRDVRTDNSESFRHRLGEAPHAKIRWLRERLAMGRHPRAALQDYVDTTLGNPIGPDDVELVEETLTRRSRQRDELDTLFDGLLEPGNRLELWDGLFTKERIEQSIAIDFCGVLDLTTCTSLVLADFIDRRRRSAFRVVQFPQEQDPFLAPFGIACSLRLMVEHNVLYEDARTMALAALHNDLSKLTREQAGWRKLFRWRRP